MLFVEKKTTLGLTVALLAVSLAACHRSGAPKVSSEPVVQARPADGPRNVVLVTIDTLRADHVGFHHYPKPTTPNLDRLARKGISFGMVASPSSWTLPAHASILTGLYPAQHGVVTDTNALPASAETLATILGDRGYDTFGAVSHVYLTHRWGFDRGFDTFDESAALGSPQRPVAGRIVNRALAWLTQRKSDKPFFMWLHIFDPHWDYAPPPPFDTKFDPDYRGKMRGDYQSLRPFIKEVAGYTKPPRLAARDLKHVIALYDGEIAYVDHELGRLLAKLDEPSFAGRTSIVVTSDHGEDCREHGSLEGHQWTLFDEVLLVPLIVYLPEDRFAEVHLDPQVSTITIAGTLLDYLGIEHKLPSIYRMFFPALRQGYEPEMLADLTVRHRDRQLALRRVKFKLIRHLGGADELYRIPHDGEHENIIAHYPGLVGRMRQRIDEYLETLEPLADAGATRQPLDQAARERLRATGYLQ